MLNTYLAIANSPLLWVFLTMVVAAFGMMKVTTLEVKPKHYDAGWLRKNYVGLLIAVATLLAASAVYFYLFGIGVSLTGIVARLRMAASDRETAAEDLRHLGTTVALLMGVLAAAATIFFSIIRVWINERTATATEEGLITDRISKAVEGLGAEKTMKKDGEESTTPNLEVRIGAIYALERIAQDSDRDHIQIMEILCAYIRENAPLRDTPKNPFEVWQAGEAESSEGTTMPKRSEMRTWARTLQKPRTDIQVALEVIGRRNRHQIKIERYAAVRGSKVGYRLDLRSTCLQGTALNELDFTNGLFDTAQLQGANLSEAQLQGAFLHWAELQGADLVEAQLQGADLSAAKLQGADLYEAQLLGANLSGAGFEGANLGKAKLQVASLEWAGLQGANFREAELQGADLGEAQLQGASLKDAQLQGADLGGAELLRANLKSAQLQDANLRGVKLQEADLSEAELQGAFLNGLLFDRLTSLTAATFRGAAVRGVDFTDTKIEQDQLITMFGDATVTLPGGHGPDHESWPEHWSKEKLDWEDYDTHWRAFQARIGQDPDNPT